MRRHPSLLSPFWPAAVLLVLAAQPRAQSVEPADSLARADGFVGSALLVLADGAMLASGYVDGRLGPRRADLLRVVPLAAGVPGAPRDLEVSNSVARWPNTLALTPDGRYAVVTEPFGQPDADAASLQDVPAGHRVTVVDLRDLARPAVVQTVTAPGTPAAVDVHPSGTLVAVTLSDSGSVALYPIAGGRLGTPTVATLDLSGVRMDGAPLPLEFKWHPSGAFAAVTFANADRVAFYRFEGGSLRPWGAPVRTAPLPGVGAWAPDGRYFVLTTITATPDLAQASYARSASLFAVIAFDDDDAPNTPPRRADDGAAEPRRDSVAHARVAHVPGGMGYVENFALSPDGRWIVGANMVASWLPPGHPGRTDYSELTLFSFDPETGDLTPHGVTRLDGVVLPQGITFDASGRHVAVTSFQHDDRDGGSLSFWRLEDGAAPALVPTGRPLPMPRGAHAVTLVQ